MKCALQEVLKDLETILDKRYSKEGMKKEYPLSEGNPEYKYVYYDIQEDLIKLIEKIQEA